RRLEARGEIRGGRFIAGVAGEQFALGETVRLLRQLRDEGPKHELVIVVAADPLNLVGILTPHERVTSNASNRIAYLDGLPGPALVAREVRYIAEPTDELRKLLHDGRVFARHGRIDIEDELANGVGDAIANGLPSEEPPAKDKKQRGLFPR